MTETIERGAMALIVVTLVATLGVYFWDREYFHLVYAAEDGLVEYGTALFLLVASVVLLVRASQMRGRAGALAVGLTCFYALLFFLAAGEEISWGQRIFGWESGEFFKENNKQYETNFHNLMVGDMHLAKTLFGSVLTVVILLYLAFGLVAPEQMHMHRAWAPLLPGFEWLTLTGFLAGAVGSFLYGWYAALLLVPLYNFFNRRAG